MKTEQGMTANERRVLEYLKSRHDPDDGYLFTSIGRIAVENDRIASPVLVEALWSLLARGLVERVGGQWRAV